MENKHQCPHQLLYNSFGILQIQTFCTDELKNEKDYINQENQTDKPKVSPEQQDISEKLGEEPFAKIFKDPIDDEIFTHKLQFYTRYELKGFNIKIEIGEEKDDKGNIIREKAIIEGLVHVRAIKFFETCMQLSYRFVVVEGGRIINKDKEGKEVISDFCKINHSFNTNELIATAGIVQGVEHWAVDKVTGKQTIDGIIKEVSIWNLHLDENSVYSPTPIPCNETDKLTFDDVMQRYRHFFDKNKCDDNKVPCLKHTYIDICDNIQHSGGTSFDAMDEARIIEHLEVHHKAELIGIMTLYPKEWRYRMDASYEDVCGKNIAIDTDDLVLTNQNMTLVVGTYGRRDSEEGGVDWIEHLKRRDAYHVCWPEYKTLIELILAKKQTINYAITQYIQKSESVAKSTKNARKMIEANAQLSIQISNIIVQLDPMRYLRYVSHKHMFKLAEKNLNIPKDEEYLNEIISKIDNSLNNANNSIELKHAHNTNLILLIISLASLFGVLLQNHEVPIISRKFSAEQGFNFASLLVTITFLIIASVIGLLIWRFVKFLWSYFEINKKRK